VANGGWILPRLVTHPTPFAARKTSQRLDINAGNRDVIGNVNWRLTR